MCIIWLLKSTNTTVLLSYQTSCSSGGAGCGFSQTADRALLGSQPAGCDRKISLHTIKYYAVFMLFIKIHCTALKSLGCQKCPSDSQLTCVQPAVSVGLCGSARSWAGRLLNADLENISIGIAL